MYSRAFGNSIESDGVLHEMERRYEENAAAEVPAMAHGREEHPIRERERERERGFDLKRMFKNINIEDLLLIAIGILLLLDGEPDNDILIIAIVFLLFF